MIIYIIGIPYKVKRGYVIGKEAGIIDHYKQTITIDNDLEYDHCVETLLHEVLHGIEFAFGLDLPDGNIERFARGLYSVLLDPQNEAFWAALAGSDQIMEEEIDVDDTIGEILEAPDDWTSTSDIYDNGDDLSSPRTCTGT